MVEGRSGSINVSEMVFKPTQAEVYPYKAAAAISTASLSVPPSSGNREARERPKFPAQPKPPGT